MIGEWFNLDNGDVNTLIRNVQKPGVDRTGDMTSFKGEMNLQPTVFLVHHKNRTSRLVDYGDISVPNICELKNQKDMDSAKENNPEAPKIDMNDVYKTYGAMIQYLRGICVSDGVPLRYVARRASDLTPISEADDPSNTYTSYDEETKKRVPIIDPGHAANTTEEDGPFSDTFIRDIGRV